MFKERAKVIAKDSDTVTIQFQRKVQCGCCRMGHLCAPRDQESTVKKTAGIEVEAGDTVEVGIAESEPLLISVLLFFVPTVILLGSLILFSRQGEFRSFFLGLVNMGVYFVILKLVLNKRPLDCSLTILRKM